MVNLRNMTIALLLGIGVLATSQAYAQTLKMQSGKLEDHGSFQHRAEDGGEILTLGGGIGHSPAVGAIELPHAGKWHLWVKSRSMPGDGSGDRKFTVRIGNQTSKKLFGLHHLSVNREFIWEDGGTFDLSAGPLLIVVGEINTTNAQCGNIMLTDDVNATSPETLIKSAIAAKAVKLTRKSATSTTEMPPVSALEEKPVATMQNDLVRISFLRGAMQMPDSSTQAAILQHIEVRSGSTWKSLDSTGGTDSYRVVYRPVDSNPALVDTFTQYPSWDTSFAPEVELRAGDAKVLGHEGPSTAPWLAGQLSQLRPISAVQIDAETVELHFAPLAIGELTARWHLIQGQPSASATLSFHLKKPGYLTLGYHGAVEDAVSNLDFLMEPYLYLGHRFPAESVSEPSNQTPTPAALVTRHNLSYAVMAEPGVIPFEWPGPAQARYVIGMHNESGKAQPFLYSPLLGSAQSLHKQTGTAFAQFRVWMQEGPWKEAYRGIVTNTYGLTDYREPVKGSLSNTVLNLFDLMHNDNASGWDARAKGSWNIEQRNTVTQPSPLSYLSYALLSGDEAFYRKYALPSLEFLISRPSSHFTAFSSGTGELGKTNVPLGGPNRAYTAAVYASAYEMTQGATHAFLDFCFQPEESKQPHAPAARVQTSPANVPVEILATHPSHEAIFDDELEVYKATGDKLWLDRAIASGDKYIADNFTHLPSKDLGPGPFVNVSFTPDWEGLLHLYEVSREPRFLKASQEGAYWLMSTVWVQPSIPQTNTVVNPTGKVELLPEPMWKGDHRFVLGFYDAPGDLDKPAPRVEHVPLPSASVPSWQISNVGLGLEQPMTYAQSRNDNNIFMSVWAANLMRLYGYTGDTLFRTYARNATIGRFAGYPGYYLRLFTNVYQEPDYVYKGPDITNFYYHQIAAFSAYVVDYVYSDAEVRSRGQFAFPSARQYGYVWFDSRLRGFAPGKVYGEVAWPWINRAAASGDNKNVDVVLAHNENTLYVALMNQAKTPQHVTVHLDPKVLGAELHGKQARVWIDNQPGPAQPIQSNSVEFDVKTGGLDVIAIDGLHIHVPAHHFNKSAAQEASGNGQETMPIAGSSLTATATYINVPEFTSRELYVYVRSTAKQCSGATLVYQVGKAAENKLTVKEFPCEFSAPLPYDNSPVQWHIEDIRPEPAS